jgi:HEAT repeat protein
MNTYSLTCLFFLALGSLNAGELETIKERISAHRTLHDYTSALEEAKKGVNRYPQDKELLQELIKIYFSSGNEREALIFWEGYRQRYPDSDCDRNFIEEIAWGVVENQAKSTAPIVRLTANLAAYLGNDARGVAILEKGLRDANSLVRTLTLQFIRNMRDDRLKEETLKLLKKERLYDVRLEVVKTLGAMKVKQAEADIFKILTEEISGDQMKVAAIQSLLFLKESISKEELALLAKSPRAALRELALAAIIHEEKGEEIDLVERLMSDTHPDVRKASLVALTQIKNRKPPTDKILQKVKQLLQDPDEETAITASYALAILDPHEHGRSFEKWLTHHLQSRRLLASSLLSSTGSKGLTIAEDFFNSSKDIYVRMNLALYLLAHNIKNDEALRSLVIGLKSNEERWMWKETPISKYIAPSDLRIDASSLYHPETINQMVRLEILNVLAMKRSPDAKEAIKSFLKEKTWGISGIAFLLLLTEGDEEAERLVEELLNEGDTKVKVQAALVLSLWGGNDRAANVLKDAYPTADRELKMHIIEGMGNLSVEKSLVFLLDCLKEPFPTLRIAAAASIIKTLYH